MARIEVGATAKAPGLAIDAVLHDFLVHEALPGTDVTAEAFFAGLARIVATLGPRNAALLARRATLQAELDAWHKAARGKPTVRIDKVLVVLEVLGLQLRLVAEGPDQPPPAPSAPPATMSSPPSRPAPASHLSPQDDHAAKT